MVIRKCSVKSQCKWLGILQALEAIECRSTLRRAMHDIDNPDDMLSTLEHFMGLEGKAASVKCSQCHSADLTCLSRLNAGSREIGWYCKSCKKCCECTTDDSVYDRVPWSQECLEDHIKVPHDPKFRLREKLEWDDFMHLLQRLPNRKAPGENLVPAELWKIAPRPVCKCCSTPSTTCW